MPKLLYITDQIYLHGGLERVITLKTNLFSKLEDTQCYICTINQKNKKTVYNISENKVQLVDLEISYNRNLSYFHFQNFFLFFKHYIRLNKIIKQLNPDLIVVCNESFDFYVLPFIKGKRVIVKEFHSSGIKRFQHKKGFKRVVKRIKEYVLFKYDHLILLNSSESKYYKHPSIKVIPNFIFPGKYSNPIIRKNIAIAAGRLAPVKRFDLLIEIWAKMARITCNWELHIYGEGSLEYTEYLENEIKAKKLNKSIFLKGSHDNIQKKLSEASIYLMTSETECFPMVLLEAMDAGLPIVSFDIPTGPTHIIKNGKSGFLIPNNDVESFIQVVQKLKKDKDFRLNIGKNAKANVKEFYPDNILPMWQSFFLKSLQTNEL